MKINTLNTIKQNSCFNYKKTQDSSFKMKIICEDAEILSHINKVFKNPQAAGEYTGLKSDFNELQTAVDEFTKVIDGTVKIEKHEKFSPMKYQLTFTNPDNTLSVTTDDTHAIAIGELLNNPSDKVSYRLSTYIILSRLKKAMDKKANWPEAIIDSFDKLVQESTPANF